MENQSNLKKWAICIGIFMCGGLSSVVSPIVQILAQQYPDVPMTTIRSVTTVPSLIAFICSLFLASFVGKKISYKLSMVMGIALCLAGGLLPAFWNDSFTKIIIGRAVFGLGFSVFSMRNAIVTKAFGVKEAATWMGYGAFVMNVISVAAQLVSGKLGDMNWRYSFMLHFLCLIPLVIILFMFREPAKEEAAAANTKAVSDGKKEFLNPRVIIFFIFTLMATLCLYPFFSSIATFISERGLGSATQAGWATSAYTAGLAVFSTQFGKLYQKFSRWIICGASVMVMLGYGITLSSFNIGMVIIGGALCGAGFTTVMLCCSKWAMDASSESSRVLAMTLISCAVSGGSFVSSYFMIAAKKVGSLIPLFETEVEKTFLIGIILYAVLCIINLVKDFRPVEGRNQ